MPASTVTVTVAGQTLTALLQADSTWNVTAHLITDGVHLVEASVTDPSGNPGTATQSLTLDTAAPVLTITGGATLSTDDATPTITGWSDAAPGSTVEATVAGQTLTTLVQGDGTWNVTFAHMTDGARLLTARVTDTAGNTASASQWLTLDTSVSVPPVTVPPTTVPPVTVPPVTVPPCVCPAGDCPTGDRPARVSSAASPRRRRTADGDPAGTSGRHPRWYGRAVRLAAGGVLRVNVAGAFGVPDDVTAAALNVTVVGPDAAGFLTVYSCTGSVPVTSSVNFAAHRDIANSTITDLDSYGDVCVYSSAGTDLVVDLTAWLSSTADNAMTAVAPHRWPTPGPASDRRDGRGRHGADSSCWRSARVGSRDQRDRSRRRYRRVPDGVPVRHDTPPDTSTVNFAPGEARPNNAIVAVGPGGLVCVFSSAAADVLVDVTGVFSPDAPLEYLPAVPQRLLDTRASGLVGAGAQVIFDVPSVDGVSRERQRDRHRTHRRRIHDDVRLRHEHPRHLDTQPTPRRRQLQRHDRADRRRLHRMRLHVDGDEPDRRPQRLVGPGPLIPGATASVFPDTAATRRWVVSASRVEQLGKDARR